MDLLVVYENEKARCQITKIPKAERLSLYGHEARCENRSFSDLFCISLGDLCPVSIKRPTERSSSVSPPLTHSVPETVIEAPGPHQDTSTYRETVCIPCLCRCVWNVILLGGPLLWAVIYAKNNMKSIVKRAHIPSLSGNFFLGATWSRPSANLRSHRHPSNVSSRLL